MSTDRKNVIITQRRENLISLSRNLVIARPCGLAMTIVGIDSKKNNL